MDEKVLTKTVGVFVTPPGAGEALESSPTGGTRGNDNEQGGNIEVTTPGNHPTLL